MFDSAGRRLPRRDAMSRTVAAGRDARPSEADAPRAGAETVLMTCRHVAQLRDTYLDGELSPALTAELHAHLLQCPACQEHFEMFRACAELITKDRPEAKLDSGFASRVVAALPRPGVSLPDLGLRTRRERRRRFWWRVAGAGLPAAAAVLFFTVLVWPTAAPNGSEASARGAATSAPGTR